MFLTLYQSFFLSLFTSLMFPFLLLPIIPSFFGHILCRYKYNQFEKHIL